MSDPVTSSPLMADDHTERAHGAKQGLAQSFVHAFHGIRHVFLHERNARIHLMLALVAFLMGVWLRVSDAELAAVFFAVIMVFLAEIFNTAIERTLDLVHPGQSERVKLIKDMSAGAVFLAAVAAVVVGIAIFVPRLIGLLWVN